MNLDQMIEEIAKDFHMQEWDGMYPWTDEDWQHEDGEIKEQYRQLAQYQMDSRAEKYVGAFL